MPKAKTKSQRLPSKNTVKLDPQVLKTARVAAAIVEQNIKEFITEATEAKISSVLKRHAPELLGNSKPIASAA